MEKQGQRHKKKKRCGMQHQVDIHEFVMLVWPRIQTGIVLHAGIYDATSGADAGLVCVWVCVSVCVRGLILGSSRCKRCFSTCWCCVV